MRTKLERTYQKTTQATSYIIHYKSSMTCSSKCKLCSNSISTCFQEKKSITDGNCGGWQQFSRLQTDARQNVQQNDMGSPHVMEETYSKQCSQTQQAHSQQWSIQRIEDSNMNELQIAENSTGHQRTNINNVHVNPPPSLSCSPNGVHIAWTIWLCCTSNSTNGVCIGCMNTQQEDKNRHKKQYMDCILANFWSTIAARKDLSRKLMQNEYQIQYTFSISKLHNPPS